MSGFSKKNKTPPAIWAAAIVILVAVLVFTLGCQTKPDERPTNGTPENDRPTQKDPPVSDDPKLESEISGLWHESPVVGSGFAERLLLQSDNTFVRTASQMDGMERVRASSGNWRVASGKLELSTAEEIRWEGGDLVPAYASWGTDQVIENAEVVLIKLTEPRLETYDLGTITKDAEVFDKRTVAIGGLQYWELSGPYEQEQIYADYEALKAEAAQTTPGRQPGSVPLLAGCWETTDRGDAKDGITRRDVFLDGKTTSVRSDWKALEFDPGSGSFSWWERDWEGSVWRVRCYEGSAAYDGKYLRLAASAESLYECVEFAGLTDPVANGVIVDGEPTVLEVIEWTEDNLAIEGWESLYNFEGKGDKPPRVW